MPQRPRLMTLKLISLNLAVSLSLLSMPLLPAVAGPVAQDSPTVQVFPGAVPIKDLSKDEPAEVSEVSGATIEELEALETARKAHAEQDAYIHYEQAGKYFGAWQLELAEIEYDEALRYGPDMKAAHRDLCLVAVSRFNLGRAVAEFMMTVGLGDAIPLNAKEAMALDNKAMHAHYKQALKWGKEDKWENAVSELKWALVYSPDDYAIHHSLAFAYASLGKFDLAEKEYAITFAAAPNDGMAHADFANLLADKGQTARAEDEMKKAVALAPNAAALHIDLGWLAESRGDLPTAAQEFKTAVKLTPKHANLWSHLGRLLEKTSDDVGAEDAYATALKLDPNLTDAQQRLEKLKQKPAEQNELDNNNEELPTRAHHVG